MQMRSFISELFHTSTATGGRKRAFVPKHMKHGRDRDAKRRKIEKSDDTRQGAKKFNKSDDKPAKKDFKTKSEKKFGGKANANVDKSNDSNASKKKLKKPKKTKGKKKSHRNKNK